MAFDYSAYDDFISKRYGFSSPSQAAPAAPEPEQGIFGDFTDAIQRGFQQALGGDAETAYQLTGSSLAGDAAFTANNAADNQLQQMSALGREAMNKELIHEDRDGNLHIGDGMTDWRTWALQTGTLLGQVGATVGTGLGIGVGAKGATKLTAKALGDNVAETVAREAAKKGLSQRAATTLGMTAATAAMAGGMRAEQGRQEVLNTPIEQLQGNATFTSLLDEMAQQDDAFGVDPNELALRARDVLAERVAADAFRDPAAIAADIASGALGGALGGAVGGVLPQIGRTAAGRAMQGALIEGGTEAVQGGLTQRAVNVAMADQGADPDRGQWDKVLSTGLTEGLLAGPLGGVGGLLHKPRPPANTGNQNLDQAMDDGERSLADMFNATPTGNTATLGASQRIGDFRSGSLGGALMPEGIEGEWLGPEAQGGGGGGLMADNWQLRNDPRLPAPDYPRLTGEESPRLPAPESPRLTGPAPTDPGAFDYDEERDGWAAEAWEARESPEARKAQAEAWEAWKAEEARNAKAGDSDTRPQLTEPSTTELGSRITFEDVLDEATQDDNADALSALQQLVDSGSVTPDEANAVVERAIRASKIARDKGIVGDYLTEFTTKRQGRPFNYASTIDEFDGEGIGDLDVKAARNEYNRRQWASIEKNKAERAKELEQQAANERQRLEGAAPAPQRWTGRAAESLTSATSQMPAPVASEVNAAVQAFVASTPDATVEQVKNVAVQAVRENTPPTKERQQALTAVRSSLAEAAEQAQSNPSQEPGAAPAPAANIIEHTTNKGKTLRGVVRADLTKDEAKAVDPYTFPKDGGWFIRERDMGKLPPVKAMPQTTGAASQSPGLAQQTTGAATRAPAPATAPNTAPATTSYQQPDRTAERRKLAVAELRASATKITTKAQAEQGRDRLTNTAKRASQAAGSLEQARRDEAMGKTLANLADAIEGGRVKALAGVTNRLQVELLQGIRRKAIPSDMLTRPTFDGYRMGGYDEKDGTSVDRFADKVEYPRVTLHPDQASEAAAILEQITGKGSKEYQSLAKALRADRNRWDGRGVMPLSEETAKRLAAIDAKSSPNQQLRRLWPQVDYAKEGLAKINRLKRAGIETREQLVEALRELETLGEKPAAEPRLKQLERELIGKKIPGYHNTTGQALAIVLEQANIQPGDSVLEPSAGKGDMADAAKEAGAEVDVIEINSTLRGILEEKGHNVVANDFMSFETDKRYDVVLMNPPFENGQDMAHTRKAWDLVKPGGRLVSILGAGVTSNSSKAHQEFRAWVDEMGGALEKLPEGSFKGSDQSTGTNAVYLVLDKPEAEASPTAEDYSEVEAPADKESLAAERADVDEIAAIYAAEMAAQYGGSGEVNDMHREFARAVAGKDGYALKFLSNGMNDAAKRAFTKATGVALPKGQGATWEAIKSWAGIAAEQDAEREAKQREQANAERDKKEAEAIARAAERIVVDGEQNGREWVDSLIERGFKSLVTKKVGAATQYWLINDDTAGFNLTSMRGAGTALWKYAKQIVGAESHADYSAKARAANQPENPAGAASGDQGAVNAEDFIEAPSGGIDFGEISPDVAVVIGRQPGKIRLQQGEQRADGTGYGLAHIDARHGSQIRNAGFDSVEQFVSAAIADMDSIWRPGRTAQIVAIKSKEKGKAVFIELQPATDEAGDFYRVNSAFPVNPKFAEKKEEKEGWERLWSRYPVSAGASGASGFVGQTPNAGESAPTVSPQSNESIASAQESSKAKSKPEAWGEKVVGAARDRIGKARADLDKDLGDDASKWKLSEAMPDLNYEKLAADGVPVDNLIAYRAARDTVPPRATRGVRLRRWRHLVEAMRNTGRILLEGNVDANEVMRGLSGGSSALGDRFKLYQALGLELMQKAKGVVINQDAHIIEWAADGQETTNRRGVSVAIDGKTMVEAGGKRTRLFQTYDEAVQAVRQALQRESDTPATKSGPKLGVAAWQRSRGDGRDHLIYLDKGGKKRPIKDGFADRAEAQAYLEANREQLEALANELGQLREVRGASNRARAGKDRTLEKAALGGVGNIDSADFGKKFGFRSVDFGDSMPYSERSAHLDRAHDALMDMADLLNVPPAALGLNGKLAIAFGSRGTGGKNPAAAHYEPDKTVINLTRNNGAGSLAHEWFHALDNYFAKHVGSINDSGAFATTYAATQLKGKGIRPEVADAFVNIIKAVERSGMAERSRELDDYRSKPYWATKVEMAARAFEAWVKFTLEANDQSNDYLANIGSGMAGSDMLAAVLSGAWPYPTIEELRGIGDSEGQGIAGAVQQLANSLRTEEVTHAGGGKTTRLFSKYNRFAAPGTAAITGMTRPQAELAIAQFLKEYKGAAGVRVNVVAKQGDVRGLPSKSDEVVRAFYEDGEVTVVLENIASSAQLKSILRHEVLAHHGLRSIVSDADYKAIIQAVLNSEKAKGPLAEVWRTVRDSYDGDSETVLAEEVIAHVAENTNQTGLGLYWDRVTGLITRALRAIGLLPKGEISRAEIRELIRSIGEGMKQGVGRDGDGPKGGQKRSLFNVRDKQASKIAAPDPFKPDSEAAERYRTELAKTMRSLRTNPEVIKVGRTPYVMTRFGAPDLELVIRKDTITKATNKVKDQHDVPMAVIERLPELLADPIAVLDDSGKFPAQVVIVDALTDGGRPVSVAVHLQVREGRAEVNRISSAYGKDNFKRMTLEYLEKGKNPDLVRLIGPQLPLSGSPDRGLSQSVLSKADLVNELSTDRLYSKSRAAAAVDAALEGKKQKIGDWIAGKWDDLTPAMLGTLTLRHLADIGGRLLPGIRDYLNTVHQMSADRNERAEAAGKFSRQIHEWARKNGAMANKLFDLMHEATIAGVDPSLPFVRLDMKQAKAAIERHRDQLANATTAAERTRAQAKIDNLNQMMAAESGREAEHERLRKMYTFLNAEARAHYTEIRDTYQRQFMEMHDTLKERIEQSVADGKMRRALIDELHDTMTWAQVQAPYFPLARFGEYFIEARDSKGERIFEMFDSAGEQRARAREMAKEGLEVVNSGAKIDKMPGLTGASAAFVNDLTKALGDADMTDSARSQLTDQIYQMYLRALPDRSIRKAFIHRKKTKGYSNDAVRALASSSVRHAYQLSRLKHAPTLEAHLGSVLDEARTKGNMAAAMANELQKRHQWVMNPTNSKLANKLTGIGFIWMLGVSPAAALVNLTQNLVVAMPVLASKNGWAAAGREMARASKEFLHGAKGGGWDAWSIEKRLSGEELAAYREMRRAGTIDNTNAHDLMGLAEGDTSEYGDKWYRAMNFVSALFHKAEVANREITGMAAYRLARKRGLGHEAAISYANDSVWDSHFDYSNANRARYMQKDWQKVALQFKQYGANMMYYLWRNAYQSLRGADADTKRTALMQLLGTLGMTSVLGGAMALPIGVVFGMANLAAKAFGDDDEPWDAEAEFRQWVLDVAGEDLGRTLLGGVIPGIDMTSRLGLNGLLIREPDRELEGEDVWAHYAKQAAGPVLGGVVLNWMQGAGKIADGNIYRGFEQMVPKFVKDGMKAGRYGAEGALNMRGAEIVGADDFNAAELTMQASGFTPSKLADTYDQRNAMKNYEQHILNRRTELLAAYYLAWREGDSDKTGELLEEIQGFNESWPQMAITGKTVRQSIKGQLRYQSENVYGTTINKRLRAELEGRFAE